MRLTVNTFPSRPVPLAWPRPSFAGLVARLMRIDAAYRQRRELRELDDRMLQDIGITRADVEREMKRPLQW